MKRREKLLKLLLLLENYGRVMINKGVRGSGAGHPYPVLNVKQPLGDPSPFSEDEDLEDDKDTSSKKVKVSKVFGRK